MKHFKFFLTGCLAALAISASAQSKKNTKIDTTTTETTMHMPDSTASKTTKGGYDRGYHLMPEVKLGSCYGVAGFGAGLVLEHEFHKYLAWDIASLEFAAPFKFDAGDFALKTGLRCFTPRFWRDNARGFMNVAAGYDCYIKDEIVYGEEEYLGIREFHIKKKAHHGFGLSWGLGIQIKEHFFLGYTLEYSTAAKFTSHYGKFGYRF